MDTKEYSTEALKTFSKDLTLNIDNKKVALLNGAIGASSEAGEALDIIKKHLFQGHDLNTDSLKSEISDVLWYINLMLYAIDSNFEEIFDINIKKLRKRYGEHFDAEKSIHRVE